MVDAINPDRLGSVGPLRPTPASPAASPAGESDFTTEFRQQLEKVSQMQVEAEQGIQNLVSGRTENITAVFTSARKAEVAFSLLMEIRNKLVDAYGELRQLRV
jgi:flagellar hook-basal body complex protein FliE